MVFVRCVLTIRKGIKSLFSRFNVFGFFKLNTQNKGGVRVSINTTYLMGHMTNARCDASALLIEGEGGGRRRNSESKFPSICYHNIV